MTNDNHSRRTDDETIDAARAIALEAKGRLPAGATAIVAERDGAIVVEIVGTDRPMRYRLTTESAAC